MPVSPACLLLQVAPFTPPIALLETVFGCVLQNDNNLHQEKRIFLYGLCLVSQAPIPLIDASSSLMSYLNLHNGTTFNLWSDCD